MLFNVCIRTEFLNEVMARLLNISVGNADEVVTVDSVMSG